MKDKKSFVILLCVFAVVIIAAAVLYNNFGSSSAPLTLTQTGEEQSQGNDSSESDKTGGESSKEDSGSGSGETGSESSQGEEKDGDQATPAPDFTITDINGKEVSLSDFFDKPVILNFWASWCGPCKSEMPDFDIAYKEYGNDINFLMVNMTDGSRETVKIASEYIKEQGYSFPVYYDTAGQASSAYSVYSIPSTYFIYAGGNVAAYAQGAIDKETLQKGIDIIQAK